MRYSDDQQKAEGTWFLMPDHCYVHFLFVKMCNDCKVLIGVICHHFRNSLGIDMLKG